jgi:hypothetical protein
VHDLVPCGLFPHFLNDPLLILKVSNIEVALHDLSQVDVCAGGQVDLLVEGSVEGGCQAEWGQVGLQDKSEVDRHLK